MMCGEEIIQVDDYWIHIFSKYMCVL